MWEHKHKSTRKRRPEDSTNKRNTNYQIIWVVTWKRSGKNKKGGGYRVTTFFQVGNIQWANVVRSNGGIGYFTCIDNWTSLVVCMSKNQSSFCFVLVNNCANNANGWINAKHRLPVTISMLQSLMKLFNVVVCAHTIIWQAAISPKRRLVIGQTIITVQKIDKCFIQIFESVRIRLLL